MLNDNVPLGTTLVPYTAHRSSFGSFSARSLVEIPAQLPKLCPFQERAAGSRTGRRQPLAGGSPSPVPGPSPAHAPPQNGICSKDPCSQHPGSLEPHPTPGQGSPLGGTGCGMPTGLMTGPANCPPQAASALLPVLCTHLSIFTSWHSLQMFWKDG